MGSRADHIKHPLSSFVADILCTDHLSRIMFENKVDNEPGPSPISVRSHDDALSTVEQVSDQPMADYSFFASKKFKLCFLAMWSVSACLAF